MGGVPLHVMESATHKYSVRGQNSVSSRRNEAMRAARSTGELRVVLVHCRES